MNRILPAVFTLAIALPGMALASPADAVPEETQATIRTMLEEDGYEVRQIQREDGLIEAYAAAPDVPALPFTIGYRKDAGSCLQVAVRR